MHGWHRISLQRATCVNKPSPHLVETKPDRLRGPPIGACSRGALLRPLPEAARGGDVDVQRADEAPLRNLAAHVEQRHERLPPRGGPVAAPTVSADGHPHARSSRSGPPLDDGVAAGRARCSAKER